jgi:hypothetical protein
MDRLELFGKDWYETANTTKEIVGLSLFVSKTTSEQFDTAHLRNLPKVLNLLSKHNIVLLLTYLF